MDNVNSRGNDKEAEHPSGKGSSAVETRAVNGSVVVFARGHRLHLRFSVDGKPYRFALGLPDTKDGYKVGRAKAAQIEGDICFQRFDPTLRKYLPSDTQGAKSSLTLADLWHRYTEVRRNVVAETTLKIQYQSVANHIAKLPDDLQTVDRAFAIRDFFTEILTVDAIIRLLTQISACCDWAVDRGELDSNPFLGMAKKIKRSINVKPDRDVDPFSLQETQAIIQAFENDPCYSYYAPYVKFLFYTGCRTGEAIALTWGNITTDCSEIIFRESVSTRLKIRKHTKTNKVRKFPCNLQLQALLQSIRPDNPSPCRLVFPGRNGRELDANTFIKYAWKGNGRDCNGIVTRLVSEGKVRRYRTQYNTRHTFISMALEAGTPAALIARWVGNSVETIMKHYAGTTVIQLPHEMIPP